MSETIIGLVTARGGSKGLPHKNILPLVGKPLIAWTIGAALRSCSLDRVIVSTDDTQIAEVAKQWGAEVPFLRPPDLARDDSPHILSVEHTLRWLDEHEHYRPDYILLLQPTSPLRTHEDIENAIRIAEDHCALSVVSVVETHHHPYLTKRISQNGTLVNFSDSDIPYLRRQVFPPAYSLNGAIYLSHRDILQRGMMILPEGTYPYIMPVERSLDIDTNWDLYLADLILKDRNIYEELD